MHVLGINKTEKNFKYDWPTGYEEFDHGIEYNTLAKDGKHIVKIGFGKRSVYGKNRVHIVVWIDDYPHAEFVGTDDFNESGEVLSEIKVDNGKHMCVYPDEPIPERYTLFNVIGMPIRINAKGVHNAWAVVANMADHRTMISLAALRKFEKNG